MKNIVYVGTSDFRGLSESDFERLGTPHKAMEFERDKVTEVSNDLASTLLDPESVIYGEFVSEEDFSQNLESRVEKERAWTLGVDASYLVPVPEAGVVDSAATGATVESGITPPDDASSSSASSTTARGSRSRAGAAS